MAQNIYRKIDELMAFILAVGTTPNTQAVSQSEADALKSELASLIMRKQCAPILVRLAWHDAGTFDKKDGSGGPRAAQRFNAGESTHGANAGLGVARTLLKPIVDKYSSRMSIADIWACAGAVAIEMSGGPKIDFRFGRSDAKSASDSVPDGRLPDATQGLGHLNDVFGRMGFNLRDIVVLSGAHTLGKCHADRSGFDGPWTGNPLVFDNSYFTDLLNLEFNEEKAPNGEVQKVSTQGTVMLTSDVALIENNKSREIVEEYAQDPAKFNTDFAVTFKKLIELGYSDDQLYYPIQAKISEQEADQLKNELATLIQSKNCAPILVRLAWHDAGTYCAKTNTGGPRACMRFDGGESGYGANAGLDIARGLLQPIVEKYGAKISVADVWAFAAAVAVEVSGGPKLDFRFGRKDASSAADATPDGRLPDATQGMNHLNDIFGRMGFNEQEIVALSGAHTLGACHGDRSGFDGPWTAQPLVFDNSYFVDLMTKQFQEEKAPNGETQSRCSEGTMMLTSDLALLAQANTKKVVAKYAEDQASFFTDFASAFNKLLEGGYSDENLYIPRKEMITVEEAAAIKKDLAEIILEKGCAPILVRLAWHDAGTFCKSSQTGGPRACMRFGGGESVHGANAGLDIARNLIQPIVDKYGSKVSVADIWALGGAVAIEISGGPKIDFLFGRRDAGSASDAVPDGRLPDATKEMGHLNDIFGRMGFNEREIVALSGAHTLGACHGDRSGFDGPWTAEPLRFDNSYFVDLVNKKYKDEAAPNGEKQGRAADGTMMLTSDLALLKSPGTRRVVEAYAQDQKIFFDEFAVAFKKLIELGYGDADLYCPAQA